MTYPLRLIGMEYPKLDRCSISEMSMQKGRTTKRDKTAKIRIIKEHLEHD